MDRIILDWAPLAGDRASAHKYLREMLGLPEYYGGNLDALYDCLTDMPPVEIIINRPGEGDYAGKIVKTICQAMSRQGGRLVLEYTR